MLKSEEVINRLKNILGLKTDLELAELLSIKPNTLASWKVRETLRYDKIIQIGIKLKIDLNEIFLSNPNSTVKDDLISRRVKMISADHLFEYFIGPEKCLATSPCYYFPTDEDIDLAFQLGTENMSPTIKVSSYLLSKRINIEDVKSWNVYQLVVEKKGLLCCRFKRYNEFGALIFISDNPAYDPLILDPCEIREIFAVKGIFVPNTKHLTDI